MSSDPEHDIPENDGPSPQDDEGLSPFGLGPFGEGPFGPREEDEEEDQAGVTILQRHHVDRALWPKGWARSTPPSGYSFSLEKYRRYKKQWAIDAVNAERELKRKKRKEVDEPLGYAKIEYDKYGYEIAAGDAHFHNLIQSLEAAQAQRAALQAQTYTQEVAGRLRAIAEFNNRNLMAERMAAMQQFARDTAEEEEALELLMMDD